MKTFIITAFFFISVAATAQYGMSSERYNGVDRSITGQTSGNKKKKNEKVDMVGSAMKILEDKLKLDSFQSAVVRQLLDENQKKEDQVVAEEIPEESKIEKIVALREVLNGKIKEILRPDQLAIFEEMNKKKKK